MTEMDEQTAAGLVLAWLPFLIYVGTWVWGVRVFKQYARSRERVTAENTAALKDMVDASRQIAATLADLRTELLNRKA